MAVSHGMDVGEVRRLGGSLQTSAGSIDDLIKRIENAVSGSTWVGPDATVFKGTWWPEHRAHLKGMSETLRGLGQSALNNASEQEKVSGVGLTGGGSAPNQPSGESSAPESSADRTGAGDGDVGGRSGELNGSHRTWQEVQKAYERDSPGMKGMGLHAYGGNDGYDYQCTSWAKYRWRELGFEGDFGTSGGRTGSGEEMAGFNGGSVDNPPSLGAMVSKTNENHVMIVEEISETSDGLTRIRVSEMNAKGYGGIEGYSNEYMSEAQYVRQSDGTWFRERNEYQSAGNVGKLVFADFPGGA